MTDKILMTQEGYEHLKEELDHYRTIVRGDIAEKIRVARSFGDLSENSEYDEAKNEQGIVEGRISVLEDQIKLAQIIEADEIPSDVASLGTTVTILDMDFKEEMTYKIVTAVEANHSKMETISDESPVGKALLGHKVGTKVEATLPNGNKAAYKILEISR